MGKSALIFGASGFVGGYFSRELKACGYEVYGSDMAEVLVTDSLDAYRTCDITDVAGVVAIVNEFQPDAIINLAAISSVGQSWKMPQTTMSVNVIGTLNVLEAAKNMAEMPKVLLIGSSEEYKQSDKPLMETDPVDATNPYGISKVTQERFAEVYEERYGLKIYRTRSFNHTGVGQTDTFVLPSWCKQVATIQKSGKPGTMRVGNLDVVRDFSDVRDIVRGYRMLIESDHAGEVFNFGSGNAHPLRDMLQSIISFADVDIEVEIAQEYLRPNDTPVIQADCTKAKNLLGWAPNFRIEDTLRAIYESFLKSSEDA